jgi:hypothetical protein
MPDESEPRKAMEYAVATLSCALIGLNMRAMADRDDVPLFVGAAMTFAICMLVARAWTAAPRSEPDA